ncbi:LysR substrate-binding domain-containing protein [Streptomyces sp. NPDC001046]|uniref:LysR substrate-binding domain-containing protein n=1 Tax=Streptomyces sp. NPDC001046 TaxID=3364543 RepID=UPI0036C119A7
MLDLRRLLLLRDLAAHGTVTAVAELHRVTPSAVSQQLKLLEEESGVTLLERTGRSLHLTTAARRLAEDTEHVLTALEQAEHRLRSAATEPTGALRLACFPSALVPLAAPVSSALHRSHPELLAHITEAEPEQALRMLLDRRADAALTYRYTNLAVGTPAGITTRVVLDDPLIAVVDEERFGGASPLDLRNLAAEPWILAPSRTACGEAVLHACRLAGFTPQVRHTASDFSAIIALAAHSRLPALVPRLAVTHLPPGLTKRTLTDRTLARTVELAARTTSTGEPALTACAAAVEAVVTTLRDAGG